MDGLKLVPFKAKAKALNAEGAKVKRKGREGRFPLGLKPGVIFGAGMDGLKPVPFKAKAKALNAEGAKVKREGREGDAGFRGGWGRIRNNLRLTRV